MKITVIGCGRWGTFIAWYLDKIGHSVSLYGRKSSAHMQKLIETRTNGLVELPETLHLTNSLDAVKDSDVIVISVNSQGLRGLMRELQPFELKNKIFVLCMKGVEIETGMRLSQVCAAECDSSNAVAVWVGPGHVQEFAAGVPNCMVIDSDSEDAKKTLVESFGSDLIRFYYGQDLIGNEIGAAAKNVVGIAAGMLDGLGLSTLKGALMARGTREIARLIDALGGNELSAYGLCHLGDYEATLFSVIRSEGGIIWACKNYDGDVMSDLIAAASGSLPMMTSVLVSPDGNFEYEAAHGTVVDHYHKWREGKPVSTNPLATIAGWAGALHKRGELDGNEDLMHFADCLSKAGVDVFEDGYLSEDLARLCDPAELREMPENGRLMHLIRERLETLLSA